MSIASQNQPNAGRQTGRPMGSLVFLLYRTRRSLMLLTLIIMFAVTAMAQSIFITIPAGSGGVLWLRFLGGTRVDSPPLSEGLHIIFPWDRIYIYDTRVQENEQVYEVISRDGLHIVANVHVRWRVDRNTLPRLHRDYGPNYLGVLLIPDVGSIARDVIAQYELEDVYSYKRGLIESRVFDGVVESGAAQRRLYGDDVRYHGYPLQLVNIRILNITLPPRIQAAIERKLEQVQIMQEYVFRIESERLESERKLIEARGVQAFQQTVQEGISDNYLRWRGIEATLNLATSPNAKVIVIGGGGSGGLPLILNTGDDRSSPPPTQARAGDAVVPGATAPPVLSSALANSPLQRNRPQEPRPDAATAASPALPNSGRAGDLPAQGPRSDPSAPAASAR